MPFSTDRDLLMYEPNLLRAALWVGQTSIRGTGSMNEGQLKMDGSNFFAAGVEPGHLLLYANIPMEIISVDEIDRATVSLPRADALDPIRSPIDNAGAESIITTFAPQRALVHRHIVAMLGLAVGDTIDQPEGTLGTDRITNPRDLARLESLGTLQHIFAAASLLLGESSDAWERSRMYAHRFEQERWRAHAKVDTNNDGQPDAVRRLNLTILTRT